MRTVGQAVELVLEVGRVLEGGRRTWLVKDCGDVASRTWLSFTGIYILCCNPVGIGCRELQPILLATTCWGLPKFRLPNTA